MNTNTNELSSDSSFSHEWFEVIGEKPKAWSTIQFIRSVWHGFIELFSPSTEIRVCTGRNRHGNTYYRVYDVLTQDFHHFESEDEVRIWFEQRHYR